MVAARTEQRREGLWAGLVPRRRPAPFRSSSSWPRASFLVVLTYPTLSPRLSPPPAAQNVKKIANQILQLSLIEVAELTEVLKEKLGINDEVMMQQLGAHYGGPVVAAAPGQEEEAKEEKTAFDVKLESFDAAKKLKVIKEVRAITGLGLKEAKELVEKAPSEVKLGVSKEEAEEIQKKLEEVGGTIKVE